MLLKFKFKVNMYSKKEKKKKKDTIIKRNFKNEYLRRKI